MIEYLSPSAIGTWLENREQFFLKYIAIERPPKVLQTLPMSVGSAFDAYTKSFLYERYYSKESAQSNNFTFEQLFEKQVEPQNRDFAIKAGAVCYNAYRASGAVSALLTLLKSAARPPRFEFTELGKVANASDGTVGIGVYNTVSMTPSVMEYVATKSTLPFGNVPLLGKPDLHFITESGLSIIDDWKVNGYMSRSGVSPVPGYVMLYDGFEPKGKNHGHSHKDIIPHEEAGMTINLVPNIELQKPDWARQLAIYSWLCGAPVGSEIVVAIDQLCCRPSVPTPNISVALHRCMLTEKFQLETYLLAQEIWDTINSDHIFRDVTLEASQERCEVLKKQASIYTGDDSKTEFLRRMRRNG